MDELIIKQAIKADLSMILDIQRKAFIEVANTFNLQSMPQIEQTLENLTTEFENCIFLKACKLNKIIGSVRAYKKDNVCHISKLIVLPEYQNKGTGKALMKEVENIFRNYVNSYELFTGCRDNRNVNLYKKLGYESFKVENYSNEISYVFMRKLL